jgi:DNA-binding response OmpR family regulator
MKKILLVEDELRMRMIVRDYLENEGYEVVEAKDGMEAINAFQNHEVDLILLDLMIPFLDGFGVCREIRSKSDIPIIIITAKEEDEDKIRGFDLGADEYVTKPFSPKVLVARVKSLLKRVDGSIGGKDSILRAGIIEVNKMSYEVTVDNQIIVLSPKEYELLLFLIKNKNKVMTRELILDNVWGYDYYGDLRTVDTHIKKLRNKLGEGSKYIKTIIRAGYMFEVK